MNLLRKNQDINTWRPNKSQGPTQYNDHTGFYQRSVTGQHVCLSQCCADYVPFAARHFLHFLPPLSSPAEHRYGSCHACQCIMCGPAGHSVASPEHIAAGSILLLQPSMPTSLAARCYPTLPTSSVPLTPITSTSSLLGTRNSSLPFPSPHLSPSCLVNASLWPLGPPCLPTVPDLLLSHWKLPSQLAFPSHSHDQFYTWVLAIFLSPLPRSPCLPPALASFRWFSFVVWFPGLSYWDLLEEITSPCWLDILHIYAT